MPFTAQELENIANAAIDFHMEKGKVYSQTIQDKPLLAAMEGNKKTFPGGKENLTVRVKGEYSSVYEGFEHDDEVSYTNPANIKTAHYPWKLRHLGISFTKHELLKDGISIVDSTNGSGERRHSDREMTALANILDDKVEDMMESRARGRNTEFWSDGTTDTKKVPGIRSIIVDDPTAGTVVGGIDQSSNSWWRNRAALSISVGSDPSDNVLINKMQTEWRQLRRYGGRPNKAFCGSDWMEQMEKEMRAKGTYTDVGWQGKRRLDPSMPDLAFKGVSFEYDPTLDDLGYAKRCYVIDTRHLYPMVIDGEDGQRHSPARPEDKYVFYRAITDVGGLVARVRNCHGVYAFS